MAESTILDEVIFLLTVVKYCKWKPLDMVFLCNSCVLSQGDKTKTTRDDDMHSLKFYMEINDPDYSFLSIGNEFIILLDYKGSHM